MKKLSGEQQWKEFYIPFSKPSDFFFGHPEFTINTCSLKVLNSKNLC